MPATKSASVHTWDDLPTDRPMDLIERQRIVCDRFMVARVSLAAGFRVPTHTHDNEQLAMVISGKIRFLLGPPKNPSEREVILTAGQSLELPSNVPHAAEAIEDTLILDIFSPPSETTGVDRA